MSSKDEFIIPKCINCNDRGWIYCGNHPDDLWQEDCEECIKKQEKNQKNTKGK